MAIAEIFYTCDTILTGHILKFLILQKPSNVVFSVDINPFNCLKFHVCNNIKDSQDVKWNPTFLLVRDMEEKEKIVVLRSSEIRVKHIHHQIISSISGLNIP